MKVLEERILKDGIIINNDILKVDSFLNHQIDVALTRELAKEHRPYGLEQNKKVAKMGGHAAKVAREDIEKNLGKTVISDKNSLHYKYENKKVLDESKKDKKL